MLQVRLRQRWRRLQIGATLPRTPQTPRPRRRSSQRPPLPVPSQGCSRAGRPKKWREGRAHPKSPRAARWPLRSGRPPRPKQVWRRPTPLALARRPTPTRRTDPRTAARRPQRFRRARGPQRGGARGGRGAPGRAAGETPRAPARARCARRARPSPAKRGSCAGCGARGRCWTRGRREWRARQGRPSPPAAGFLRPR